MLAKYPYQENLLLSATIACKNRYKHCPFFIICKTSFEARLAGHLHYKFPSIARGIGLSFTEVLPRMGHSTRSPVLGMFLCHV